MKTIQSIDLYLWKHYFPELNPLVFKSKGISFLALAYISLFPLPRKFLRHYLSGSGKSLTVDTKNVIAGNPEVFDLLLKNVAEFREGSSTLHEFPVSQLMVNNPNYKYALGSFKVICDFKEVAVDIRIHSTYHYGKDNDRITRHLHNWLYSRKEKGKASDFSIEGDKWTISYSDLPKTPINNSIRKYIDFNRLYI